MERLVSRVRVFVRTSAYGYPNLRCVNGTGTRAGAWWHLVATIYTFAGAVAVLQAVWIDSDSDSDPSLEFFGRMLTRLLGLAIIRGGGSLTTLTQCALYGVRFVRRSPTLAAALGGVLEAQYCCPVCMSNTRGPRVDLRHHTVRVLHTSSACRAGHNKWSKIKRHKAVTDQEKSRLRGKLLNQIRAAVASGGNDPATNVKLGGILTQARSSGVPKGNMEAALKLNSGGGSVREAVIYEGRGPSGYLVIIEALTDNRKRTRPEIRHIIEKQGYG